MKIKLLFAACLLGLFSFASASYVRWTAQLVPADARAGESAQIVLTAKVDSPWHIYQLNQQGGPNPTAFELPKNQALTEDGQPVQPAPKKLFDPNFKITVGEYENAVAFGIPVKISAAASAGQSVKVSVSDQTCNAHTCAIPETIAVPLQFTIAPGPPRPDHQAPITAPPAQPSGYSAGISTDAGAPEASVGQAQAGSADAAEAIKGAESKGFFYFFLFSFLAGLAALATPCVFPMIPITVSYFAKAGKEGKRNYPGAISYCVGIISTFSVLGLVLSILLKGSGGINTFAANAWVNLVLAVLFIILGISLFGVFEIRLPNWVVNKAYSGTRKGGLVGPFLMGLTFTLTSFTCTAPVAGAVLGQATQGQIFYPLVGMIAFGLAFSLPFFVLALFPQYLASLPKSGSWLNTVKGFMAFIELAAAVKFLSNADLVWQLAWLTRPVFLAIWAVIGAIAALYLFGMVSIGENGKQKIGWVRGAVGLATVACTVLFLTGVGGNTNGFGTFLLAWLPPSPYPGQQSSASGDLPYLSDYQSALALAKSKNQDVFVDFTGVTCTNCRAMEEQMFPKPEVRKLLGKYVLAQLYTDRPTSTDRANAQLEQKLSSQTTLPMYVIVSPDGKPVKAFSGYTDDTKSFVQFLEAGQASQVAER